MASFAFTEAKTSYSSKKISPQEEKEGTYYLLNILYFVCLGEILFVYSICTFGNKELVNVCGLHYTVQGCRIVEWNWKNW